MTRAVDINGRGMRVEGRGVGVGGAIPDSGVFRYEFEDDSDTSVAIDSWNNNDGTITTGANYTTTAQIGSLALDLAGSGYVDAGDLLQSAPFSISVWIYPRDWSAQRFQYVASTEDSDANGWFFRSDENTAPPFQFQVTDGSGSKILANNSQPPENSWTLVTGTYGTDGTVTLYKNDSQSDQSTGGDGSISNTAANALLGESAGFTGRIPDAIVDDSRAYNKELTAAEVSNLYNTGSISG